MADALRQLGIYAGKILKGANPAARVIAAEHEINKAFIQIFGDVRSTDEVIGLLQAVAPAAARRAQAQT